VRRRLPAIAVAAAAVLAALAGTPADASPAHGLPPVGADVSHPQCPVFDGQALLGLPAEADLAVVGVDDGVAALPNPCLAAELRWARAATAGRPGLPVSLYLNTADPGPASARWPSGGDAAVPNPYGACRPGSTGAACAFRYGWSLAAADTARVAAPAGTTWWLDVESANTWSGTRAANLAVLEGMAAAIRAAGGTPGVYANRSDWRTIVGPVPASSPLRDVPTWLAGATTQAGAAENCRHATLTGGGRVALTQYLDPLLAVDGDVACS